MENESSNQQLHKYKLKQQQLVKNNNNNTNSNTNENTIKKLKKKLSLQIKFTQINNKWYKLALNSPDNSGRMRQIRQNDDTKMNNNNMIDHTNINNVKTARIAKSPHNRLHPCPSPSKQQQINKTITKQRQIQKQQHFTSTSIQQSLQHSISELQSSYTLLSSNLSLQLTHLKQHYEELLMKSTDREQLLSELSMKRLFMIQTIKINVELIMREQANLRQEYYYQLEKIFNCNIDKLEKQYKKVKKQWKYILKSILIKIQHINKTQQQHIQQQSHKKSTNQPPNHTSKLSITQLHSLITQSSSQYSRKLFQIQTYISELTQTYQHELTKSNQHLFSQTTNIFKQITKLSETIHLEVQKQHRESQENRQKILLYYEENVVGKIKIKDKNINASIRNNQQKSSNMNLYRNNHKYRHETENSNHKQWKQCKQ